MSDIILLSTYKEDLRAFENVLQGQVSYSLFMRTPAQAKEELERRERPELFLCSMSASYPHFFDIFYWLQNSSKFAGIPAIFILDTGQEELVGHLSPSPHILFLFRSVPQDQLFRAIQEQLSQFPTRENFLNVTQKSPMHRLKGKIRSVRLEHELGRGGAGVVLLGYQETLDRQVAVKVLAPTDHFSKQDSERLQREARAIGKMKHPNIVQCYDAGFLDDGCFYIVMEYLSGQNLEDVMTSRGLLPQEQVVKIILQVAEGLAAAHDHELVHRDIKPSNLIMNEKGHVTITDFGLAIHDGSGRVTKTGVVMGTPYYLAPEQAVGSELTPQVDIYSLGIVFYEMLTGRLPIEDENPFQAVIQRIQQPYFDPRDIAPLVHPQLADLICQMTRTKVEERTKNCHVVIEVLKEYIAHSGSFSYSSPSHPGTLRPSFSSEGHLSTPIPPSPFHQESVGSSPSLRSLAALGSSPSLHSLRASNNSYSFDRPIEQRETPARIGNVDSLFNQNKKTGELDLARALEKALSNPDKVKKHATMSLSQSNLRSLSRSRELPVASYQSAPSIRAVGSGAWSPVADASASVRKGLPEQSEYDRNLQAAKQSYIRREYKLALQHYEKCLVLRPGEKGIVGNIEKLKKRLKST